MATSIDEIIQTATTERALLWQDVAELTPEQAAFHPTPQGWSIGEILEHLVIILVRGPNIMRGYLNTPDATRVTIAPEGWLPTGDIAYVDDEGDLFVVDRLKELIKYKGFQVAPAELEGVLLMHPAIADAAVIGIPDEEAGEVPKAFVVLKAPVTAEALMSYVASQVAPHKRIRQVEVLDAIPKSASGKILRRVLVERDQAQHVGHTMAP